MSRAAHIRTSEEFGYRPALDGLRAVAVIAVLLFHSDFSWARGGYLGVSSFFTLSGFLITTLLVVEYNREGRINLRTFWARRARRLLPAAFLAVLLASFYVLLAGPNNVVESFRGDGLAALLDVANWRFVFAGNGYLETFSLATGVRTAQSPVLHFWSLAIEEQFYVFFPALLVGLLRLAKGRLVRIAIAIGALTAISVGLGIFLGSGADNSRAYFGTDTRAAELLVGALLALALCARGSAVSSGSRTSIVGVISLGVMLVAWMTVDHHDRLLFRGGLLANAGLTAVVILVAIQQNWFSRALSWRPLVALGRISYGIYLFHWPIFQWTVPWAGSTSPAALLVVRSLMTLAVSVVSYYLLEQPIRLGRVGRRTRTTVIPAWTAVSAFVFVAWALAPAPRTVFAPVAADSVADGTSPTDLALSKLDDELPAMPTGTVDLSGSSTSTAQGTTERTQSTATSSTASGLTDPTTVTNSTTAPFADPKRILIVGDSVALTLGRGFERYARDESILAWNIARSTCGIPRAEILVGVTIVKSKTCENWPELWSVATKGFDPDVVVVLSPIWDAMPHRADGWDTMLAIGDPVYDDWLLAEYEAAADILTNGGAKVFWLDSPCAENKDMSEAALRLNAVIARLDMARGDTKGIEISDVLCDPQGDWTHSRDVDGFHFSDFGADLMAKWLVPKLH